MMTQTLITLFERDLNKLKEELWAYQSEENIWKVEGNIANSAGNLVLHLIGNLNTYIGAEIGKTGYVRNRPLEFSDKNVPRTKLLKELDDTIQVIKEVLPRLSAEDFEKEYPILVFDKKTSTEYFLTHLVAHLAYHLGQVNYHRRLLDEA
ncbi:DinB family protein [Runella zeae]|uniref:DinB family protein n=1 Tax=Runella zeae TaxID=94255 RepID=UPI000413729F|nr:DinB family protein [Runella zeae]